MPRSLIAKFRVFCLFTCLVIVGGCGLGIDNHDRLIRGQEALEQEEFRAAIIDAKRILQDEPNNSAARLLLGIASVEIGDAVGAEIELRRANNLGVPLRDTILMLGRSLIMQQKYAELLEEIDPDDTRDEMDRKAAHALRGSALLGLDRIAEAREVFTSILESDPTHTDAVLGVVRTYIAERNYLQARQSLDLLLGKGTDDVSAWILSGSLYLQQRDVGQAERDLRHAAELARAQGNSGAEMTAYQGLADALFVQQRADEVQPLFERMQALARDDVRTMFVGARIAYSDQRWSDAQEALQDILRVAPNHRPAQTFLGAVHKESGNLGQAEMYLSAVVAALPDNAFARRMLAETRLELNKSTEARHALEPLLDGSNTDLSSLSLAASASLQMGDFDEATLLLERGLAIDTGNIDLRLQLAFAHIRAGKNDAASAILRELPDVRTERNQFQRDSLLILTQIAEGETAAARAAASELAARWPGRPEAFTLLGTLLMIDGEYDDARRQFSRASEIAPESIVPIRYLAQLDELEGESEAARQKYEVIIDMAPTDIQSMIALARLAVAGERHRDAIEWLERARQSDASAFSPQKLLAALYLGMGDYAIAETTAAEALEINNTDAGTYNILGLAQLSQSEFRDAAINFENAVRLDDTQEIYRLNLAKAQAGRGNISTAVNTLERQRNSTMEHLPSAIMLAMLRAESGEISQAKRIAIELQEKYPDAPATLALLAELLYREGDLLGAANAYDKALDMGVNERFAVRSYQIRNEAGVANRVAPLIDYLDARPLDSNLRVFLAQAYEKMGDLGKAIQQYEIVLNYEPDNFIAANNLAWNYFQRGDARAADLAQRAYAIRPDNASVADTLGWILVQNGEVADGVEYLRKAMELDSSKPEIRYHLAAGLAQSGQTDEARTILQQLLDEINNFDSKGAAQELLSTL